MSSSLTEALGENKVDVSAAITEAVSDLRKKHEDEVREVRESFLKEQEGVFKRQQNLQKEKVVPSSRCYVREKLCTPVLLSLQDLLRQQKGELERELEETRMQLREESANNREAEQAQQHHIQQISKLKSEYEMVLTPCFFFFFTAFSR